MQGVGIYRDFFVSQNAEAWVTLIKSYSNAMKSRAHTPSQVPSNHKGTAVVTGATSGIGKAYAERLAADGFDLVITGRRRELLNDFAAILRSRYGVQVLTVIAELSDENDLNGLIKLLAKKDDIFFLVNNAGFGSGEAFCQCTMEEHMKMLNVHVVAALKLIYTVLPQMIRHKEGAIINVSSMGAFTPAPGSTMYASTKLFLKSFTESLHMEVKRHGIKVQCICPGFTRTEFHSRRKAGKINGGRSVIKYMEAGDVVKKSMKALERDKVMVVPGFMNRLLVSLVQVLPKRFYYFMMEKASAKEKTESEQIFVKTHAIIH
jgi:short-subunit dehydrogenase